MRQIEEGGSISIDFAKSGGRGDMRIAVRSTKNGAAGTEIESRFNGEVTNGKTVIRIVAERRIVMMNQMVRTKTESAVSMRAGSSIV